MKIVRFLTAFALVTFVACGGGGGGGGGNPATPTRTGTRPTAAGTPTANPNASPTPTPRAVVGSALFVRATAGADSNDGRSPGQAFRTIRAALAALPGLSSGRTLVVGPGTYRERLDNTIPNGSPARPVVVLADPTGASTQESPGPVILMGTGSGSMITLNQRQFVEIDGFVIRGARGANNAGIDIRSSSDITVRNCEISGGNEQADGIAVITSNEVLLVNNLVYENARRGVRVAGGGVGSRGIRLINNTIANNDGQGVVVGASDVGSEASLFFNIIQDNVATPDILVSDSSLELFFSDANLVFPGRYSPTDLPREFHINVDAQFVDPVGGFYLLRGSSPAIDGGFEEVFPADLLDELAAIKARATSTSGAADSGELDLGFHAVGGEPIPLARTFYVRQSGDDDRASGRSPTDAFGTVSRGIGAASGGDTVIVGPGTYAGRLSIETIASTTSPLLILADPTGFMTEDGSGNVDIDASSGRGFGFRFTGAANVILDGFRIFDASDAGVEIRSNSSNITVRNCFIDGGGQLVDGIGNGITVDDSTGIAIINNAMSFNDGSGIQVRRSSGTRIINNTVAENGARGIRVGSGTIAATDTLAQNNIVTFTGDVSIEFNPQSAATATLSHNLVFPHVYRPLSTSELAHPTDIDADAGFVAFGNFLLSPGSPARNAADPATDAAIRASLANRTTMENEAPDAGALDLGYHFPILPPTPTPTPRRGG